MKWRMSNNQVELAWVRVRMTYIVEYKFTSFQVTGGETENLGYIVEKRPSYGGDFQEIASFNEVSQLQSKGAAGGRL